MCEALAATGDPLALSLGLDILEDILAAGDRAKHARAMAREGALAALVRCAGVRGLGGRAVLVLAQMAAEPELLHVLRALLQPHNYACLTVVTARAVIELSCPLPAILLQQSIHLHNKHAPTRWRRATWTARRSAGCWRRCWRGRAARACARSRWAAAWARRCRCRAWRPTCSSAPPVMQVCVGSPATAMLLTQTCLTMHAVAGLVALQNLPADSIAEASIAAALLLEHAPGGVSVLLRPGALRSLVDAVLKEATGPDITASALRFCTRHILGLQPITQQTKHRGGGDGGAGCRARVAARGRAGAQQAGHSLDGRAERHGGGQHTRGQRRLHA